MGDFSLQKKLKSNAIFTRLTSFGTCIQFLFALFCVCVNNLKNIVSDQNLQCVGRPLYSIKTLLDLFYRASLAPWFVLPSFSHSFKNSINYVQSHS